MLSRHLSSLTEVDELGKGENVRTAAGTFANGVKDAVATEDAEQQGFGHTKRLAVVDDLVDVFTAGGFGRGFARLKFQHLLEVRLGALNL